VGIAYSSTMIPLTVVQEGWCSFVALLALTSSASIGLLLLNAAI
jgi:hypothetical protein